MYFLGRSSDIPEALPPNTGSDTARMEERLLVAQAEKDAALDTVARLQRAVESMQRRDAQQQHSHLRSARVAGGLGHNS
jgi:hypothetical protein